MNKIEIIREKIDRIDSDIIKLISERNKLSLEIGNIKLQSGIKVLDMQREKDMMIQYEKLSSTYNLQPDFIKHLFSLIISLSKNIQNENSHDKP